MNEGLPTYLLLSAAQREERLRRSGLETLLVPAEGSGPGKDTAGESVAAHSYKQYYRVRVFNLEVLEIQPLGTGAAMKPAALPPVIRAGVMRGNGADEGNGLADIALHGQEWMSGLQGEGGAGVRHSRSEVPASPGRQRGAAGKMRDTAVRALYTLGLDSGEVLLKSLGGRRYRVDKVTPLRGVLPEPYRAASLALARSLALEQPGRPGLLMGMDPEFLLLRASTGRAVPA
ncbi:hypothetical protein P4H54_04415, partial [Paenibacillus graminis]|nr:hypothetical protein [Paenibacillus graminis]